LPDRSFQKRNRTLPPVIAGADIIVGYGEIEGDQLLVLEQILVDNEIGHLCQRLWEGVDCTPEKDLFDEIAAVGPGGHFMMERGTRRAARSGEFYIPRLFDRHTYAAWAELGRPTLYSAAREQVRAILESPLVDPLSDDVMGELDDILRAADREIEGVGD